jgi:type I restriction enzyme, S subunit
MTVGVQELSRAFAVRFRALDLWSVGSQLTVRWGWPSESIRSLGDVLSRRVEPLGKDFPSEQPVHLLTIRFDGSIEPRPSIPRNKIKGRLFRVCSKDVVFSKIDVRNGAIGLVPDGIENAVVTSEFPTYSVRLELADPQYIKLLFRTNIFMRILNSMISGASGRKRIQPKQLENVVVPLPPLQVQQMVVTYWKNNNTAASQSVLEADKKLRSITYKLITHLGLKELKPPISDRVFVTTWHNIERWGVDICRQVALKPNINEAKYPAVRLRDVIMDLQNGWSPKCHNRQAKDVEWGVLKVGAVSFGFYDESQNKALPDNLKPRPQYEVKEGDLIISRANITRFVGACALVKSTRSHLMLCDKLFRVIWKVPSPIMPEYLDEVLKLPQLRWQIENNLTGASPTMKNISKPALLNLNFPLPPLAIQGKLVAEIEAARSQARYMKHKSEMIVEEAKHNIEEMILGIRSVERV